MELQISPSTWWFPPEWQASDEEVDQFAKWVDTSIVWRMCHDHGVFREWTEIGVG